MVIVSGLKKHSVLLAVLLGAFSLVLTNSAFNILLPSFVEMYGIPTAFSSWIIILYILAMTITMPLTSLVVDRLGRKKTYIAGIGLYGLFSILGGLFSQYIEIVLLVRVMHGIAAGLMIPLSLVLLFDYYGKEVRGRVVGAWGILLMIAPAIGPTLGGAIIQFGELKYLFWINVPFALFSFLLCCTQIKQYPPVRRKTLHLQGITLMVLGIASLSLGIQMFSNPTVPSWIPYVLLILGAATLVSFIRKENVKEEPLIRYSLLKRNPVYTVALLISAIQDAVMFGVIFVLPLIFQEVLHLSPSMTGAMFIPTALFTSLFVWVGGSLVDSGKSLKFIAYGIGCIAVSVLAFAFVPQGVSFIVLLLLMSLRGIGNGLSDMTVTAIGLNSLQEEDLHEGSALSNTIQRLTSSFAIMLLGLYYDVRWQMVVQSGELAEHAKWTILKEECIILGVLMILTLPLVSLLNRKREDIVVANGKNTVA
ncbi:MFS transporter [Paenibacillus psychroresistens]|uniref:MFS transporter n=1 Tax=Paenibacillus psychroresistens TaxID=1778678 RepID=A0A6B8RU46_9BACL|nr:MFS transporter [Paenibacillus psychroresistens]QGQ99115.1 MFS transporter [Paenibacillus psychroresistens]